MTEEQKNIFYTLKTRLEADVECGECPFNSCSKQSCTLWAAIEMIEQMAADLDAAKAENERIRQTHVRHGAYQMEIEKNRAMENDLINYEMNLKRMEDKLEQAKRERDAAARDFKVFVHDGYACKFCAKDRRECGSHAGFDCELFEWRGPCAENGGGQK